MPPPPRFLHEHLDDGEVWVDLEAGRMYGVNETGVAILQAWRGGLREPLAIADHLAAGFEISPEAALAEVNTFLDEARERGLLDA